jgi:dihydroorotase-like cyclic amidohydrolase
VSEFQRLVVRARRVVLPDGERAAAAGGGTMIVDVPLNSIPPTRCT